MYFKNISFHLINNVLDKQFFCKVYTNYVFLNNENQFAFFPEIQIKINLNIDSNMKLKFSKQRLFIKRILNVFESTNHSSPKIKKCNLRCLKYLIANENEVGWHERVRISGTPQIFMACLGVDIRL